MRRKEPEFVRNAFEKININFVSVDARKDFFEKIRGITDPEQKRKIIGEEFIRVFEKIANKVGAGYFIQGTIYPDRIESGIRKFSEKIKTHHNVAGLPTKTRVFLSVGGDNWLALFGNPIDNGAADRKFG